MNKNLNKSFANTLQSIWYDTDSKSLLRAVLYPLSIIYLVSIKIRELLYKLGLFRSYKSKIPIIVIGNITVGGTGKTPMVIKIVKLLQELGLRPAVVTRGYHAKKKLKKSFIIDSTSCVDNTGDEPWLIYNNTNIPVVVGQDRVSSVKLLESKNVCNIIVCDDGLQHYKLKRDMELCLIDGSKKFGNQFLLPLGPLREPISRLDRLDYVLIKNVHANSTKKQYIYESLDYLNRKPHDTYGFNIMVSNLFNYENDIIDFSKISHDKTIAISGLANNTSFINTLNSINVKPTKSIFFSDHYQYTAQDVIKLLSDYDIIITTEKDAVKLYNIPELKKYILNNRIVYLKIDLGLEQQFIESFNRDIREIAWQYKLIINKTQHQEDRVSTEI